MLHPACLFAGVWAIAIVAWMFAPDNVLEASISGNRAGSTHAFFYFAGCLSAFVAGAFFAGLAWPRRRPVDLRRETFPGMELIAVACSVAVLVGGLVWMTRISIAVGSPVGLVRLFLSGHSVADLKFAIAIPAQLPPITTMVHLTPAAASMLLVRRKMGGWEPRHRVLMAGLVVLTVIRTLVLAERFAALGLVAGVAVTILLTVDRVQVRRVLFAGSAGLFLLWFAWSAGEFSRSWMDSRDGDSTRFTVSNFKASLSYSQDRLGAYLFTAINNGVIIVDQWSGQEFPANFAPVVARSGLPGLGAREGAGDLYHTDLSREFTGESMPGRFFLDAREFGVVLALVYGTVFGLSWRAATLASPAGIVLYASLSHVLLDTYRSAYLFDLQGAAGFAGAAVVLLAGAQVRRLRGTNPNSGLGEVLPAPALSQGEHRWGGPVRPGGHETPVRDAR